VPIDEPAENPAAAPCATTRSQFLALPRLGWQASAMGPHGVEPIALALEWKRSVQGWTNLISEVSSNPLQLEESTG